MGRNIIFLDIDGVLNTERYIRVQRKNHDNGDPFYYDKNFDPITMNCLKKLYDKLYDPIIVLSSTWRNSEDLFLHIKTCLIHKNIIPKPELYKTPNLNKGYYIKRGLEIQKFIDEFDKTIDKKDIIIIDDDNDMEHLSDRLILCDQFYGFNKEKLEESLKLFNIK